MLFSNRAVVPTARLQATAFFDILRRKQRNQLWCRRGVIQQRDRRYECVVDALRLRRRVADCLRSVDEGGLGGLGPLGGRIRGRKPGLVLNV
jgi:hypothetical protein